MKQEARKLFAELEMEFQPVAIKFHYSEPEGVEHIEKQLPFCAFLYEAQRDNKVFYTTKENDLCNGKLILGMVPFSTFYASGIVGKDYDIYKTQGGNAKIYKEFTPMIPGTVNYVQFSPVSLCDFDPDLIICFANTLQAEILMRATSYISGDLWESKSSSVMSCAWTYMHPYNTGKVNFLITGMHNGLKKLGIYPPGMHIISIPYQKIQEVIQALGEMDWELLSFKEDPESKAKFQAIRDRWETIRKD